MSEMAIMENLEDYYEAERIAKREVYLAKKTAEKRKFSDLKPGLVNIFKIAEQLQNNSQDIIKKNDSVKDDSDRLTINDPDKRVAWRQYIFSSFTGIQMIFQVFLHLDHPYKLQLK